MRALDQPGAPWSPRAAASAPAIPGLASRGRRGPAHPQPSSRGRVLPPVPLFPLPAKSPTRDSPPGCSLTPCGQPALRGREEARAQPPSSACSHVQAPPRGLRSAALRLGPPCTPRAGGVRALHPRRAPRGKGVRRYRLGLPCAESERLLPVILSSEPWPPGTCFCAVSTELRRVCRAENCHPSTGLGSARASRAEDGPPLATRRSAELAGDRERGLCVRPLPAQARAALPWAFP